ncbi:MAG: regulator of sigma protease [Patescibacteria group bacterium]|nr:regulator of sigma protease [Patescibacteria group bacterium]
MELFFGIILGLIILVFLVVSHELGHAIVAHRNGVAVEEFGIGLPPRAWKKKLKNGVLFSLNWLPLGGFVKLQGEYDSANKKGDYGAASFIKKTKILLAGVTINWLLAAVIFTILSLVGLPKALPDQVTIPGATTIISQPVEIISLTEGYPAQQAGLIVGDKITKFAGQEVSTVSRLIELTKENRGQLTDVMYVRNGVSYDIQVTIGDNPNGGYLGANLGQRESIKASFWAAPALGVATTAQFSVVTLQGVGDLIGNLARGVISQFSSDANVREQASSDLNTVSEGVAGPIGILGTIFPAAQRAGLTQLLFLTGIISLSLAVMNILPIPALDGGRWLVMTIFRLTKKDLTKEREEKIQTIGFLILMSLVVLVTFVDVSKLL